MPALVQAVCRICGETKSISEFYSYRYTTVQGKRSTRTDYRCKSCQALRKKSRYSRDGVRMRAVSRAYKHRHANELNEKMRVYRLENVEKVRVQRRASEAKRRGIAGSASGAVYQQVLSEAQFGDRWLDAYSGELIISPTIDHIVSISNGGRHEYDNLCVTSRYNNTSKHSRSLLVWMAEKRCPL